MPAQCRTVQAPALAALLPTLHLNRHSPHVVIIGSHQYGGLSLPDLYTDQCSHHLTLFIGNLKLGDNNEQLILSLPKSLTSLHWISIASFVSSIYEIPEMD